MRRHLATALTQAITDVGADAGAVIRITAGHQVVVASTVGREGEEWPAPVQLDQCAADGVVLRDPHDIARALPTSFRLALGAAISQVGVIDLEQSGVRVLLAWCGEHRPDALARLSPTTRHTLRLLAPLLDEHEQAAHAATVLTTVVSALDHAVVVIDRAGATQLNPAARRLLALTDEQVDGEVAALALRALRYRSSDPEGLERRAIELISDPTAIVRNWAWHLVDEDLHLDVATFPVAAGLGSGRVWVFEDVTEQVHLLHAEQRARAQLAEREQQYRLLAENASDVVFQGSPDAVVQWVSPSVQDVLGLAPSDVVGRPVRSLVFEEDLPRIAEASRDVNVGQRVSYRARYRTANGELRWSEVVARPVYDEFGNITARVGSLRDVHDEVMASLALEESERTARALAHQFDLARTEAEAANLAKTTFLSRMSHELRTPLNAVTGFAQLLEMDDLTDAQRQAVGYILAGGRHLLGLINEVLDISRIEVGKLAMSMEPVDLAEACREAIDMAASTAASAGITIEPLAAPSTPIMVRGDRQRMVQVVLNLLTNAVKYNRPGGTVSVRCAHRRGGEAFIGVRDTGYGIAPDHLDRLFEPFDRLGAESSGIEGTGIGLTLSNALAGAMGGRIEVDSTPDVGSEFRLVLISGATPEMLDRLADAGEESSVVDTEPVAVLYVEDNPQAAELMRRVVQRRPHAVLRVERTGDAGIAAATADAPDLIFLDLQLPDVSGEAVLTQLRQHPTTAETPVVVVTADATPGLQARLLEAGADGFVTKPIAVLEVLRWLDRPR